MQMQKKSSRPTPTLTLALQTYDQQSGQRIARKLAAHKRCLYVLVLRERLTGQSRDVRLGAYERLPDALQAARRHAAQLGIAFIESRLP
jgi:hypothetical protein